MSQWPHTLSKFLGTNVHSYAYKKAHVSKMSTCSLNSFVWTVNEHARTRTHTPSHTVLSLMIRPICLSAQVYNSAPYVEKLREIIQLWSSCDECESNIYKYTHQYFVYLGMKSEREKGCVVQLPSFSHWLSQHTDHLGNTPIHIFAKDENVKFCLEKIK